MLGKNSTTDPKKLIERAKAGDSEAFETLYLLYLAPLYRYVYFRVLSKEEAEDLVQSVFLKVYRSLPNYRQQGKEPLAFFYTVARNAIIDYQRKKRELLGDTGDVIEQIADEESEVFTALIPDRYQQGAIREALLQLSDDQREVVLMKFMQDMDYAEIASAMDKSEVAVRQIQSRALKALRSILAKYNDGE
ncbi:MAG: hypothetical protein A3A33_02195 [Candidatus Yanofskybacteria bacterium RIFCSPLOWO2_01_FULL_49_25]|uniref:RNA polymerase sigma factor n=1 Tax=Candidatus Yanofskybacteria bacterium RIFCSPLOWO2_01_FULL_49_25 TaxID=1802701 RepID=A0A1F8GRZ5_9BACT|nr:MAG: hypothetical protein A3A33_02195 [Candidatus Yanofskybacteria bacterium RIFCSPLOWO2_01_FULL_49_25]